MKKEHPSTDEVITSNGFKLMALVKKRWQWATLITCASTFCAVLGYFGRIAWADRTSFIEKLDAVTTRQGAAETRGGEINLRLNVMFEKMDIMEHKIDQTAKESQDRDSRIMELLIRGR